MNWFPWINSQNTNHPSPHPKLEFCYIVEGSVKIIEKDGPTHVFNAGDSFVVPKGTPVTWVVEEYAKKIFVSAAGLEGE